MTALSELQLPSSLSPAPRYTWLAKDARGLSDAWNQATARALAGDWASDASTLSQGTRMADVHALLILSLVTASSLSLDPPRIVTASSGERSLLVPFDAPWSSGDRKRTVLLGACLGWMHLARITRPEILRAAAPRTLRVVTEDPLSGGGSSTVSEAGMAPLAIAGIVAAGIVASGAAAAILFKWGGLSDALREKLYGDLNLRRILAAQARKTQLLAAHAEAEVRANAELAFTAAETGELASLEREIVAAGAAIAAAAPKTDSGFETGAMVGVAALALALLYWKGKG